MPKMSAQARNGYVASIRDANSPVKPKLKNITQSVQFKRWFGDWQKHTRTASKIVNPDGAPKIVYYDAANSGSGVYRLTDDAAGGEAAYLNIRNPYRVSQQPNPQAEAQLIRHAQQKGYDGIVMEGSTNRYLAFRQEQIKSANDNIGTFDKTNPDIRRSVKGAGQNTADRLKHADGKSIRPSEKTKTREQAFTEDKYFKRQMDRWDELADGARIKVGVVREHSALNQVGIPASSMFFDVGKIRKALDKHGDHLSADVIKRLPDMLADPIVITEYKGASNTVNVYGELWTGSGIPIVVGVVMRKDANGINIISNIRTIHARSNFAKQITDESVLYLNEDKKRTRSWFHDCGNLNVPLAGTRFGLIRSIAFEDGKVNFRASVKRPKFVGLSMMHYTLEKARRTCLGERQLRGLIGKLLY